MAIYTEAINDTLGAESKVPSALMFREFPSIGAFIRSKVPRETMAEKDIAAQEARKCMSKYLEKLS